MIGVKKISTFTTATARQHGWSWQAPVQERYGNGYVFNNNFVDVDTVLDELQIEYKDKIKIITCHGLSRRAMYHEYLIELNSNSLPSISDTMLSSS